MCAFCQAIPHYPCSTLWMFSCGHLATPPIFFSQFITPPPKKKIRIQKCLDNIIPENLESNEASMWRQGEKLLRTMAFSVLHQQIPNCVYTEYTILGADVSPRHFLVSFGPFATCQFSPLMCKKKLIVHPHLFLGFLKRGWVELLPVWRGTQPGWSQSPQTWLSHWAHLWPLYLHVSEAAPLSH